MSEGQMSPAQWLKELQSLLNPGARESELGLAKVGRLCRQLVEDKWAGEIPRITGTPGVSGTDKRVRLFIPGKGSPNPISPNNIGPLVHRAGTLIEHGLGRTDCIGYFDAEQARKGKRASLSDLKELVLLTGYWFFLYYGECSAEGDAESPVLKTVLRDESEDVI